MSFEACASLVERADPDRFLATMAAPPKARKILFPLYAFNVEVARAPWVTAEPMIAEMRLQWWRDVLEEIAQGRTPRRHDVVDALAEVLEPEDAALLDGLVAARRWDIYKDAFEDEAHLESYIDATSGHLMFVAARRLGEVSEPVIREFAYGAGVARLLHAVPELESRGRIPLLNGSPQGVIDLATRALERLHFARLRSDEISKLARPALWAGWQAEAQLKAAIAVPERVIEGKLDASEFARRTSLMRRALFCRF